MSTTSHKTHMSGVPLQDSNPLSQKKYTRASTDVSDWPWDFLRLLRNPSVIGDVLYKTDTSLFSAEYVLESIIYDVPSQQQIWSRSRKGVSSAFAICVILHLDSIPIPWRLNVPSDSLPSISPFINQRNPQVDSSRLMGLQNIYMAHIQNFKWCIL